MVILLSWIRIQITSWIFTKYSITCCWFSNFEFIIIQICCCPTADCSNEKHLIQRLTLMVKILTAFRLRLLKFIPVKVTSVGKKGLGIWITVSLQHCCLISPFFKTPNASYTQKIHIGFNSIRLNHEKLAMLHWAVLCIVCMYSVLLIKVVFLCRERSFWPWCTIRLGK